MSITLCPLCREAFDSHADLAKHVCPLAPRKVVPADLIGILNAHMTQTKFDRHERIHWDQPDIGSQPYWEGILGQSIEDYAASNPHMIVYVHDQYPEVRPHTLRDLNIPATPPDDPPRPRDLDWSDVVADGQRMADEMTELSGNPDRVDMTRLVESILPLLAEVKVHPWTFALAMIEHIAEDEYGRGGFEQYNVRDAEGELWGVTVGMADEE